MEIMCQNPFRKKKCPNQDVEVIIRYKGENLDICSKCWKKIAKSDLEWGE